MHPAAQRIQVEFIFSRSLDMKGTRNWIPNLYIQDFIWDSPNSVAKLLFILKVQNQSPIGAYINWATTCVNNNMIYKGKLWMQVRCGFYV